LLFKGQNTMQNSPQNTSGRTFNGVDPDMIRQVAAGATSAEAAACTFTAQTTWEGGFGSTSRFEGWSFGGHAFKRSAWLSLVTPQQMQGSGDFPTPLEAYLAALNGCLVVGFVLQCSLRGVEIRSLSVTSRGSVDARSFLRADLSVSPAFPVVSCTMLVDADASPEGLEALFEVVKATSPNRANVQEAVGLEMNWEMEVVPSVSATGV